MKKNINLFIFLIASGFAQATPTVPKHSKEIGFTPNRGQVRDQFQNTRPDVLFGGQAGSLAFHLRTNGISYQLSEIVRKEKNRKDLFHKKHLPKVDHVTIQRLDINWIGANENAKIISEGQYQGYTNYYTPSHPEGIKMVPSYNSIRYCNLYPSIDLHYYDNKGELEYDFIVSPGADYRMIKLEIKGADHVNLEKNGEIVFKTALGNISEAAPIVYQDGKQRKAKWVLKDNVLSFEIENYDKTKIMIIDPVSRAWGTYYGGSGDEAFFYVANTANNDVLGFGGTTTAGGTVIATSGAYQSTFGGGSEDACFARFNSAGVRLWATYFGGIGDELAFCGTEDASGNILISGSTDGGSGSVFGSPGSHQPSPAGNYDAFLSKFTGAGLLIWSTYYGGVGDEESTGCSVDVSGNIFICGYTDTGSGTAVATTGAHQPTAGGSYDGFLAKFNSLGVRQWGTYYGGTGDENLMHCATDPSGNIIVVGFTDSPSSISSSSAFMSTIGGMGDGFIVKFSSAGVRQWGTYYGGLFDDALYMNRCDATGNIYVIGDTESSSGLGTTGTHQPQYANSGDAYVAKFDASGSRLWGSYYGGIQYDESYGCTLDPNGELYLSGASETSFGTAIATPGSHQPGFAGGTGEDGYIVKFSATGTRQWGSYYGGNDDEIAYCSADATGAVYLGGYTMSSGGTAIATAASHQPNQAGNNDCYLAKFNGCTAPAIPTGTSNPANLKFCTDQPAIITMVSAGATEWYTVATGGSPFYTGATYTVPTTTAGTYTVYVGASECTVSAGRNLVVYTVQVSPSVTITSTKPVLCKGETATLTASGALTYTWASIGNSVSIVVTPSANANYTATGTSTNGCNAKSAITQSVTDCIGIEEQGLVGTKFYPNPCTGNLNVDTATELELGLYNAVGQNLGNWNIPQGLSSLILEVPAGVYFLKIRSGENESIEKLIIER